MVVKKLNNERILLIAILLLGFFVRLWGINFGLPALHVIDEGAIMFGSFFTGAYALQPLRYMYAPFIPYIILIELVAFFFFGKLIGIFDVPQDLLILYLKDPTTIVLIGRMIIATFGVLTIWALWKLGETFFNKKIGLVAAFLLSLTFLHIKESHYIKEDILTGFFILLSFYFTLWVYKEGKTIHYILTGVFFAFAIGTKYIALIFLPVIIIAHLMRAKTGELKKILMLVLSFCMGFFLVNPYFFLEFSKSFQKILADSTRARVIYPSYLQGKSVWCWFINIHIPQGIGILFYIIAIFGFLFCLYLAKSDKKYFLVTILPIIFIATIDLWTKYHNARYAVMILPFFALAAAIIIVEISDKINNQQDKVIVLSLLAMLIIFQSSMRSLKFNIAISQKDTRSLAKTWIEANIPFDSKILVEASVRPEYPSNLNVPLILSKKSLNKRIQDAEELGHKAIYLKSLKTANEDLLGYDIISTSRVDITQDLITSKQEWLPDAEHYIEREVNYLVLSSWAIKPDIKKSFMESIRERYELIKIFKPSYEFQDDPHLIQMDYQALDSVSIFNKDIIIGPIISIYKIKEV